MNYLIFKRYCFNEFLISFFLNKINLKLFGFVSLIFIIYYLFKISKFILTLIINYKLLINL